MKFTDERLHHSPKEVLEHWSPEWKKLPHDAVTFLEEVVDECHGELSTNKWKKLYALLAQFAADTHKNFRVYRSTENLYYDTTTHSVTTDGETLLTEPLHQEVEAVLLEGVEAKVKQLKRWRFELEQLSIKIDQMTVKRDELKRKYDIARSSLMEEL